MVLLYPASPLSGQALQGSAEKCADVNLHNNNGDSPLTRAVFLEQLNIIKLLVYKGANVNHKNFDGSSSLILSGYNDNIEIIQFLIEKGGNIHNTNNKKNNALMIAAAWNNFNVCRFLVSNGVDLMALDIDGCTALDDYGINTNNYDGIPLKIIESRFKTLNEIYIQYIKDERWERRKALLIVLIEHAYLPLKHRVIAEPIIVRTSKKEVFFRNIDLIRFIIKFI